MALQHRIRQPLPSGAVALIALGLLLTAPAAASADTRNPHHEALAALGDIHAAIKEITDAADLTVSDADPHKQAAERAINALVGRGGAGFNDKAGNPGDDDGALGHLTWLRGQSDPHAWDAPVQASLVNVMVAKARLSEAANADDLDEFRAKTSDALEALLVATGSESNAGPLGALRGALATTDLGVPPDGKTVSGCAAPTEAPAFGVVKGHLIYVAVPQKDGPNRLPAAIGVRDLSIGNGMVVLHTAATDQMHALCPDKAAAAAPAADPPAQPKDPAGLYTKAQAEAGQQVYTQHCVACHGDKLQGKSAPPVAGSAFLKKAKALDWSVADMRNLIVTTMPRDNPGSLTPQQYADVTAYLLAVDCYPAGESKFPANVTPAIKAASLTPANGKAKDPDQGTCPQQVGQQAAQTH
jgi:polar amino acid transport system substrate-binding protein